MLGKAESGVRYSVDGLRAHPTRVDLVKPVRVRRAEHRSLAAFAHRVVIEADRQIVDE